MDQISIWIPPPPETAMTFEGDPLEERPPHNQKPEQQTHAHTTELRSETPKPRPPVEKRERQSQRSEHRSHPHARERQAQPPEQQRPQRQPHAQTTERQSKRAEQQQMPDGQTTQRRSHRAEQQSHAHERERQSQPRAQTTERPSKRPERRTPVLARNDLLHERRDQYIQLGIPLYEASIRGDWKAAEVILEKRPDLVRFGITGKGETALHVAASAKNSTQVEEFIRNLVDRMEKEDVIIQDKKENTALTLAATSGSVRIAEILVDKNRDLLTIPGPLGNMPLNVAALFANREMVSYLYSNSREMNGHSWHKDKRVEVLLHCVEGDLFGAALKILKDRPELVTDKMLLTDVLSILARKTYAFVETKPQIIWRFINSVIQQKKIPAEKNVALQLLKEIWINVAAMPMNDIDDIIRGLPKVPTPENETQGQRKRKQYPSRVLFIAAKMGNTRFIIELIRSYPDLIWKLNDKGQSIFHIAVKRRHESLYNLLYEIGSRKDLITPLIDDNHNNLLHLVGKNAKTERIQVSGVALQMQRELLWFMEVKQMIPPAYREWKNKKGLTPHELFTETHKDLVSAGEKWMKGTAAQCMVVATLIATIVFAAAFTLPGGYSQNTGFPIFLHKRSFMVFAILDAISVIFSCASILMFLSMLTSRYAEHDFLESLPKKLMISLTTLFLSIATMMVAFSANFFVLYHQRMIWVPLLVTGLGATPVFLFTRLQYPLLRDVFHATYGSRYLFKPKKSMLYC